MYDWKRLIMKRKIKEFLSSSIRFIVTILLVFFVMIYVFSLTQVVGNSMKDTLVHGDILILNKFKYHFAKINRRDIVVFQQGDSSFYIKRIIGLPGETIKIQNNCVYINGRCLIERYLKDNLVYEDFNLSDLGYDVIPKDMYFVLGDNRENSEDSREFGLIKKEKISGKIDFRIWPITDLKAFR